jgi:hypothetical protein
MSRAAETGQTYQTLLDPPPLDLGTGTVAPLPQDERPVSINPEPELDEPSAVDQTAEESLSYAAQSLDAPDHQREEATNGATGSGRKAEARSPTDALELRTPSEQQDAAHDGHATPEAPNPYDATLALHACVPDGGKVERDVLLADAARELGYANLTRKVRRALNKALSAENNAGRLRTGWERAWRPKKR